MHKNRGGHCIKGWSKTQALIVLSSGESEFYAALKAAAETLGMLSMMADFGWKLHGEVWGDANAALGIINRNGLGKTRHLQTGLLWIQQIAAEQRLKFGKVLGANNPADLFTKHLDEKTSMHHTTKLGFHATEGRPIDAPNLHNLNLSIDVHMIGNNYNEWPWLYYLQPTKDKVQRSGASGICTGDLTLVSTGTNVTDVWQQVLRGSNWSVQGYNGSNAAQLNQPLGSTLTFQLNAGVPTCESTPGHSRAAS